MHARRTAILALPLAASLFLATGVGLACPLPQETGGKQTDSKKSPPDRRREVDKSKWLDKLKFEDRAAAEFGLGFALPAIPEGLEVVDGTIKSFKELRGKVVVLVTFSTKSASALKDLEKLKSAIEKAKLGEGDPVLVGVHTPDAIDKAKENLAKAKLGIPVILDKDGALCDALGAYKVGITSIADRQGALRYAGLSDRGVIGAIGELGAETFDETAEPKKIDDKPAVAAVEFPTSTSPSATRSICAESPDRRPPSRSGGTASRRSEESCLSWISGRPGAAPAAQPFRT